MRVMVCPRCEGDVTLKSVIVEEGARHDLVGAFLAVCRSCRIAWREDDWRIIRPHVARTGPLYALDDVIAAANAAVDDGLAGAS